MLGAVPFGSIFKAGCILDYFSYMNSLSFCCADGQGNLIVSFVYLCLNVFLKPAVYLIFWLYELSSVLC
jgi:hypothetical protein